MANVEALLKERGTQWEDAVDTHTRIAAAWSATLNHIVNPVDVALMMVQLKVIRAQINPGNADSYDDIEGYTQIAKLIAGHPSCLSENFQDELPL